MNLLQRTLCLSALALLPALGRADDGAEPPVVYTLEIDGQSVAVTPDEPVTIEGEFSNPTVTLRVAKTRALEAAGIAFSYPAYFTFEADTTEADLQTWTASGKDVTVMLFSFGEEVDPLTLAELTADQLESQDLQIEPIKLKLGDAERSGVKANMTLAGSTVIQQVLTLPPTPKGSRLLVVQEVRDEGQPETAELGATLKLVASSLTVKP